MANVPPNGNHPYTIINALDNDVGRFLRGQSNIRPFASNIVVHWTAGTYRANDGERKSYHYLIQPDSVLTGIFPILANRPPLLPGRYAAHTANFNNNSIGVAMCGMLNAVPRNFGRFPLTETQWDTCIELCAELLHFFKLPVSERTLLGHCEVQRVYGKNQQGRWDPWFENKNWPWSRGRNPKQIGDNFRSLVSGKIEELNGEQQNSR